MLQPDSKKYQPFWGEPCQLTYVPPSPILPCRYVFQDSKFMISLFLLPSLSVLESVLSWSLAGNKDGSFSDTDQARRNARLSYILQPQCAFVHLSHPHSLKSSSDTGVSYRILQTKFAKQVAELHPSVSLNWYSDHHFATFPASISMQAAASDRISGSLIHFSSRRRNPHHPT